MRQTYLTQINIKSVRHLKNICIPLSSEKRKHLLITGKNGSGKTSVLEALKKHLQFAISSQYYEQSYIEEMLTFCKNEFIKYDDTEAGRRNKRDVQQNIDMYERLLENWQNGATSECVSFMDLREKFEKGEFVLAYYGDERKFQIELYKNIEKIELKDCYQIEEKPGAKLAKYLVDLKAVQAFSKDKDDKVAKIEAWFNRFENILKKVFEDESLSLVFNTEDFQFSICQNGREPFDFNTMSSGYAAVFDIINDLIVRMEAQTAMRSDFDLEGIVLIDEIETHLHLELQKKILPILTELFPNIQFIISTHSPFILSSLKDAVIYDLEKKMLVENGMENLPYEGIVEGYFGADRLSDELREKYERYKVLVGLKELDDAEYAEIEELEYYLDEIPDYLASEITSEYSRLKLEFSNRG